MSIAYQLLLLNLTAAGEQLIQQRIGYLQVVEFQDAAGAVKLDGKIEVQLDGASAPYVPLRYNGKIALNQRTEWTRVKWAAQADTYCLLLTSPEPDKFIGDFPNPKQLVTSAIGTQGTAAAVVVGVAAVQLTAADATRQSAMIQNLGAADIYVGFSNAVAVASGIKVAASGGALVLDKQTSALWAISAAAGNDVRVAVEKA